MKAEEIKAIEKLAHYVSEHIHRNEKGEILITDPDGEVRHLYVSKTYEQQLMPYLGKGVDLCGSCYNLKQIFKTNGYGYPICHECYGVTAPKTKPQRTMRVVHGGKKVGRNDECPCGSNMKYKKCCLKKSAKF